MTSNSPPSRGLSPDDALPPVEPPSAGFILQLFVVPGVIVVIVVMIWLLFNYLAQMGNDRKVFVRDLKRNNEARWQAAYNLATALRAERGSRQPKLTADAELAAELAGILDQQIDAGSMDPKPIELRIYLCRALGEFHVSDGFSILIKAATTERSSKEAEVRRAALEGIALLASNQPGGTDPLQKNEQLEAAILKAADDADPRTQAVAAVAMGVIGGKPFVDKLHSMIGHTNPDVRYNVATRLAVQGDPLAVPVLVEMLEPENAGVEAEQQKDMRPFKRAVITLNALRAVAQLAEKNRTADLGELRTAVEKLAKGEKVDPETRVESTAVLRQLDAHAGRSR